MNGMRAFTWDYPSGDCELGLHGECVDHEMGACTCECHPVLGHMCDVAVSETTYANAHELCNWEWCRCPCHHFVAGARFLELRERVSA